MLDPIAEMVEGGEVVHMSEHCMTVEVDGVELHVSPRTVHSGCSCCGDRTELRVSYNRLPEDRGGEDPLGIKRLRERAGKSVADPSSSRSYV